MPGRYTEVLFLFPQHLFHAKLLHDTPAIFTFKHDQCLFTLNSPENCSILETAETVSVEMRPKCDDFNFSNQNAQSKVEKKCWPRRPNFHQSGYKQNDKKNKRKIKEDQRPFHEQNPPGCPQWTWRTHKRPAELGHNALVCGQNYQLCMNMCNVSEKKEIIFFYSVCKWKKTQKEPQHFCAHGQIRVLVPGSGCLIPVKLPV